MYSTNQLHLNRLPFAPAFSRVKSPNIGPLAFPDSEIGLNIKFEKVLFRTAVQIPGCFISLIPVVTFGSGEIISDLHGIGDVRENT
jgi:hypothetical protein